jgi:hypothetical protein
MFWFPIYWGFWPGGSLFTMELSDHLGTRIFGLVIFEIWNQPFFWVPSGKLTVCYWKLWFIVDLPSYIAWWFSIVMEQFSRGYISFWAIPDTGTTSRTSRCRGLHFIAKPRRSRLDHDSISSIPIRQSSCLTPKTYHVLWKVVQNPNSWQGLCENCVAFLIYQHFLPSGTPEDGWYHLGPQLCRWHVIPAPLPTRQGLGYVRGTLCYNGVLRVSTGFGERDSGPK